MLLVAGKETIYPSRLKTPSAPGPPTHQPKQPTKQGAATGIMYIQSGLVTKDLINHPEDLWKFGSICPALKHGHALKHLGQALVSWLPL